MTDAQTPIDAIRALKPHERIYVVDDRDYGQAFLVLDGYQLPQPLPRDTADKVRAYLVPSLPILEELLAAAYAGARLDPDAPAPADAVDDFLIRGLEERIVELEAQLAAAQDPGTPALDPTLPPGMLPSAPQSPEERAAVKAARDARRQAKKASE